MKRQPRALFNAMSAGRQPRTRKLAIKFAGYDMHVNAVATGVVQTPLLWRLHEQARDPRRHADLRRLASLGRIAPIADVVEAILRLASPRAAPITGAVVPIDGGVTAGLPAIA